MTGRTTPWPVATARRLRRLRPRTQIVLAVAVLVALPLSITGVKWLNARSEAEAPVEAVREFLEASRSGDVEAALDLASDEPSEDTRFLTDAAIDGDWEIDDLALSSITPGTSASVQARIIGPQETPAVWEFELSNHAGAWRLDAPFSTVHVDQALLPYLDVNGFEAELANDHGYSTVARLLPGVYEFYSESDVVDAVVGPQVLLGGQVVPVGGDGPIDDEAVRIQEFAADDEADPLLQERIDSYLDECVSGMDDIERYGCPFGVTGSEVERFGDGVSYTWEIVEYPQVTLMPDGGVEPELGNRDPGSVELTIADGNDDALARFDCPAEVDRLYLGFDVDGRFWLGPREDPETDADDDAQWAGDGLLSHCRLM